MAFHEFSVRYREALAERHMTQQQSMDTVRDAIREQYSLEQETKHNSPAPDPEKDRGPQPPEPDI